jgi:glutaredoxin 3
MHYVIYGKDNCKYCIQSKALLTNKNLEFTYLNLGEDYTKEELLLKVPDAKTLPQIFGVSDKITTYIGGYEQLENSFLTDIEKEFKLGHTLEVEFTKSDGEVRKMLCTRNPKVISENLISDKKTERTKTPNPEVISVFDLDKNSWRSFRLNSVISYSIVEE